MKGKISFTFSASIWKYSGPGGWNFVSLPQNLSLEIRNNLKDLEEGWGRMKVWASIVDLEWETAIWFDTKQNTYLLPLKSEIRKKGKREEGQEVEVKIWI